MAYSSNGGGVSNRIKDVWKKIERASENGFSENHVRYNLPTLVAVSKTKPLSVVMEAYTAGQLDFGENYIQELVEKAKQMPDNVKWHFIGNIQSNKCKLLCSIKNLASIQSVASLKVARALNRHWNGTKPLDVMIQINTSNELSKGGVHPSQCHPLVECILEQPNLTLRGLMSIGRMASPDNPDAPVEDFLSLRKCRQEISAKFAFPEEKLDLSMGMSGDFEKAIQMGSTCVRLGTIIFGEREYLSSQRSISPPVRK